MVSNIENRIILAKPVKIGNLSSKTTFSNQSPTRNITNHLNLLKKNINYIGFNQTGIHKYLVFEPIMDVQVPRRIISFFHF